MSSKSQIFRSLLSFLQSRSSSKIRDVEAVHARVIKSSLFQNPVLAAKLISAYSSPQLCNLRRARAVFEYFHEPNIFVWNSLIRVHAQAGLWLQTLEIHGRMTESGIRLDKFSFFSAIRACAKLRDLEHARRLHRQICSQGFDLELPLANAIVNMYVKCQALEDAWQVFEKMPVRDVVSWTSIISGHAQQGNFDQAMALFCQMRCCSECKPNFVTLVALFTALQNVVADSSDSCYFLSQGEMLHGFAVASGLERHGFVATSLLHMYANLGCLESARVVFDEISDKCLVSWTAMISGYAHNGKAEEALGLLQELKGYDLQADAVTIVAALGGCDVQELVCEGRKIHAYAVRVGLDLDDSVMNSLAVMYAKCGDLRAAVKVFHGVSQKAAASWNAIISGFGQEGSTREAFRVFHDMQTLGIKPDPATFVGLFSACSGSNLLCGKCVHGTAIKLGFEESNVFVGTSLTDMYSKCGEIGLARQSFEGMQERNVVSWSTIISGHVQNGMAKEALMLFKQMKCYDVQPNLVTLLSLPCACSWTGDLAEALNIHAYVHKSGFESDVSMGTALVDMYAKCGNIVMARKVFERANVRDVITWNAMIGGCVINGYAAEALELFDQMQNSRVPPNSATMKSVLPACGMLSVLQQGKRLHNIVLHNGLHSDVSVVTALVDMYAKCGSLGTACDLFLESKEKDTVLWNTMISALGMNGKSHEALELFRQMQKVQGIRPDEATFVSILSACSHGGLVKEGRNLFSSMVKEFHISPKLEHYSCMVDLLGRSGHLQQAHDVIMDMPLKPDAQIWGSLLGACRTHGNVELGQLSAQRLFELELADSGHYGLFSNTCALSSQGDDVGKIRAAM